MLLPSTCARRCRPHRQFVNEWLKKGQHYPVELHEKAYKAGIQGVLYPKEVGGTRPDDFDAFHEVILWDELGRQVPRWDLAAPCLTPR